MVVKMDNNPLAAKDAEKISRISASASGAMDGKNFALSGAGTMDSIVKADLGQSMDKNPSSTVYTEAEAKGMQVSATGSDLEIMDPADFISQSMTGEDAKDLSDEKTPLEQYTSSQLERALARVKEQRSERADALKSSADEIREDDEKARERASQIADQVRIEDKIQRALAAGDMPINPANISGVKYALELAKSLESFSDSALKFMSSAGTMVTPKSIHDSVYASGVTKPQDSELAIPGGLDSTQADGADQIDAQLRQILTEGGRQIRDGEIDSATWLYENDLPVTVENIANIHTIKALKEVPADVLLDRIVSEMGDGRLPDEADLSALSTAEVKSLVKDLTSTDDQAIRRYVSTEDEFTLTKSRLEQIRLEMTIASARTMTKLGIELDIKHLSDIVDGLKEIEDRQKSSLIAETKLRPTDANMDILYDTVKSADRILAAPVELLGISYAHRDTLTLSSMSENAIDLTKGYISGERIVQKDVFRAMESTYEAVGTEVRSDLGDSIKKAFGNISDILSEIGLSDTAENARAVRILGYNRMEITAQSVSEMRAYDEQVSSLMKAMKPPIVQRMINERINPLELSFNELQTYVERASGQTDEKDLKFSEFLWKLDKKGEITPEQKQSMIGVYRLLDKIERSDGAVIGALIQQGRDLSLKNMLSAIRSAKKSGVDVEISDELGALEQVITKGRSIDDQIEQAYRDIENTDDTAYYEQMVDRINTVLSETSSDAQNFLESLSLPPTIANLSALMEYISGTDKSLRLWTDDESKEAIDNFDNPDEIDDIFENIENTHRQALDKSLESDDISYDQLADIRQMTMNISFHGAIRAYQMYEVPVVTEQGVVDCTVTIRGGAKGERGTVDITAYHDSFGAVQATFKVRDRSVKGFVTTEDKDSYDTVRGILDIFEKDLEESGFTMESDSLVQGSRSTLHTADTVSNTTDRQLYHVAKIFLQSIGKI